MSIFGSISGRKVDDDPNGAKEFGGRVLIEGKPATSEEIGTMTMPTSKATDWSATIRAWGQEPAPSVEQRLAALEEQG
jgi:hypothetical protein